MDIKGKRIHFMGVGGIGVSALAEMALRAGASVSGCDREASEVTRKLEARGVRVMIGHDPAHVAETDLLVYTSAIPPDHPERVAAGSAQVRRGQFLAECIDKRFGIGICGTHGKTTTSWLAGGLLLAGGLDPAIFIGGMVPQLPDGNYRLGTGPFVAELDESDGSFLLPELKIAVITNIESDHLSHYRNDASLFAAFARYAAGVSQDGLLVAGTDNPLASDIFRNHSGRKLSFGLNRGAELHAVPVASASGKNVFRLGMHGEDKGEFQLSLPGNHNILNALAAIACAGASGVGLEVVRRALPGIRGVARRLESLGMLGDTVVYTDYAHHPTEVAASLAAVRQSHPGPILLVFQPHLYSRTRDYADAFAAVLARADAAVVVDIYPAREEPIPGVTSGMLVERASSGHSHIEGPVRLEQVEALVKSKSADFAAVVFMGAGDIDSVARRMCP